MKIREAIILAGGMGTRLKSVLPDLPKCLAPVAGTPFLSYVINHFKAQGIEQFIFSLGYKHEVVEAFLKNHYPDLAYKLSVEEKPLGTGGAIFRAVGMTEENSVIVLNGDTLFAVQLNKLLPFHFMTGAHCTLSLKPMQQFDRYGAVQMEKDYRITAFDEKKFCTTGNINGGVYALNAARFRQEKLGEVFSFEKDYLEAHVADRRIYGVLQDTYFIDIGIPEDYERAQHELTQIAQLNK
jgi:D-glycero-alpha-D-manno-heptose 1-phosphate guanylyltransferase